VLPHVKHAGGLFNHDIASAHANDLYVMGAAVGIFPRDNAAESGYSCLFQRAHSAIDGFGLGFVEDEGHVHSFEKAKGASVEAPCVLPLISLKGVRRLLGYEKRLNSALYS